MEEASETEIDLVKQRIRSDRGGQYVENLLLTSHR